MATYKVPQDVEAEDKLIGPFSFRQFIYLIIVALAGALAWGLAQVFIPLAIIPLPIILLFGALALPLRKDQPMEIYLAAMISFLLKPHRRLWDPEGVESLIEITAPKTVSEPTTKNLSQDDADQRFSYLADIVDSRGWAIRGAGPQAVNSAINTDVFVEAQRAPDVLDTDTTVAQSFDYLLNKSAEKAREEALARMRTIASAPQAPNPFLTQTPPTPAYDPYPSSIQQTVLQPVDDPRHVIAPTPAAAATPQVATPVAAPFVIPEPTTSDTPVAPVIMNLASNTDVSIETLAREAQRLQKQEDDMQDGAVISLH